jgi:hypothetical protein
VLRDGQLGARPRVVGLIDSRRIADEVEAPAYPHKHSRIGSNRHSTSRDPTLLGLGHRERRTCEVDTQAGSGLGGASAVMHSVTMLAHDRRLKTCTRACGQRGVHAYRQLTTLTAR